MLQALDDKPNKLKRHRNVTEFFANRLAFIGHIPTILSHPFKRAEALALP